MFVRVSMTLDLDVRSPQEAAKMLEPMLASLPAEAGQFSWTIKGQEFFAPSVRTGKRVARREKTSRTRSDDF